MLSDEDFKRVLQTRNGALNRSTDFLNVYELWSLRSDRSYPDNRSQGLAYLESLIETPVARAPVEVLRYLVEELAVLLPVAVEAEDSANFFFKKAQFYKRSYEVVQPRQRGRPRKERVDDFGLRPGEAGYKNALFAIMRRARADVDEVKRRGRVPLINPSTKLTSLRCMRSLLRSLIHCARRARVSQEAS